MTKLLLAAIPLTLLFMAPAFAQTGEPSRPAEDGCTWEKLADVKVGLGLWAQKCDFGDRQIELHFDGDAVVEQYSDGGDPTPVIQFFKLLPDEPAEDGMLRVYREHTEAAIADRCIAAPSTLIAPPAGVQRSTFVPDEAYAAELAKTASPDEVPEPPCGPLGDWPDGIQYFELHPASPVAEILFVVAGQDAPLFDEQTLELLAP